VARKASKANPQKRGSVIQLETKHKEGVFFPCAGLRCIYCLLLLHVFLPGIHPWQASLHLAKMSHCPLTRDIDRSNKVGDK